MTKHIYGQRVTKYIYVVAFKYGRPKLTKVEVVKETAKLYQVGYLENIIDRQYIPSRVRKDSNVFDTEIAALQWLEKAAQEHVKKTVKHLEESRQIVSDIRMRLEE